MSKFATGRNSNAYCDRCGQKYKYSELKPLTINRKVTEIRVCPECWEGDQPQYRVGELNILDPQALRNARPDSAQVASRNIYWGWNPTSSIGLDGNIGQVSVTTTSLT